MSLVTLGDRTGTTYTGGEDMLLKEAVPLTPQATGEALESNKFDTADFNNSLLRFPALSTQFAGKTILGATLYLYVISSDGADYTINVHRMLRNWDEATADWLNFSEPVLVDYQQSDWTTRTSADEVTPTVTWQAGDRILCVGAVEDFASASLNTPTAVGLTFSALSGSPVGTTNTSVAYMWEALAADSGSSAVTGPRGDAGSWGRGIAVFVYRNCSGFGTPASILAQNASVISLTRTQGNSHVVSVMIDWSVAGDVTVTGTPGSSTQRVAAEVAGGADFFLRSWGAQGATGTTNYGHTAGAATVSMTGLVVEVLGNAWTTPGALGDDTDRVSTVSAAWLSSGSNVGSFIPVTGAQFLADVQAIAAGTLPNYGWGLYPGSDAPTAAFRQYASSDNSTPALRPYLELTLMDPEWNLRRRENRPAPWKPGRGR